MPAKTEIKKAFQNLPAEKTATGSTVIVITGGSGCGKTTLAKALVADVFEDAEIISHDMYYIDKDNFDPDYRVDYDAPESLDNSLLAEHIQKLQAGEAVETPIYDFQTRDRLEKTHRVEPKKFVIVEGILAMAVPEIRQAADLNIFIHVDDDIRLSRRMVRDFVRGGRGSAGEGGLEGELKYYFEYVKPNYKKFIAPLAEKADIVLHNNSDEPQQMIARAENIFRKFQLR